MIRFAWIRPQTTLQLNPLFKKKHSCRNFLGFSQVPRGPPQVETFDDRVAGRKVFWDVRVTRVEKTGVPLLGCSTSPHYPIATATEIKCV